MVETDNQAQQPVSEPAHQPGTVIAPGGPTQPVTAVTVMPPAPTPQAISPSAEPDTTIGQTLSMAGPDQDDETVTWTASEFVAHHKTAGWYAVLAAVTLAVAGLLFLLTHAIISGVVIIVGGIALASFAGRQPRQLDYQLNGHSLTIAGRPYPLAGFRSYAVVQEGPLTSIIFMPLKRFAPATTVYFAPEDEDRIFALLSSQLPFEDYNHDFIDNLMHRIRF